MGLEKPLSYVSSVSGFTPTTVTAALDALAGARIKEMGNNSDGTYVKWENGLMVCWSNASSTHTHPTADGSVYRSSVISWAYPAAFTANPMVLAMGSNYTWGSVIDASATIARATTIAADSSSREAYLQLFAIGKWK